MQAHRRLHTEVKGVALFEDIPVCLSSLCQSDTPPTDRMMNAVQAESFSVTLLDLLAMFTMGPIQCVCVCVFLDELFPVNEFPLMVLNINADAYYSLVSVL